MMPRMHRSAAPVTAAVPIAAAMLALAPSWAGAQGAPSAPGLDRTHPGFCAEAQRRLTGTTLPVSNAVEAAFEPFKRSKPAVQPIRTHQFLEADPAGRPLQLSCKTKSADHLRSAHGAAAAAADRSCRDLHRDMVNEVWRALTPAERARAPHPPWRVMLDADTESHMGSSWLKSRAEARRGADGLLHLRAAGLFAEWEDWRWKFMPEPFRGNHYCHLVAPERIRRLMLGEAAAG
jgi:hypothetical protein